MLAFCHFSFSSYYVSKYLFLFCHCPDFSISMDLYTGGLHSLKLRIVKMALPMGMKNIHGGIGVLLLISKR